MRQPIPLAKEIIASRDQLELPFDHGDDVLALFQGPGMKKVRDQLLLAEVQAGAPSSLILATFWDITPKYRYDVLMWEIRIVANDLVLSTALANIYQGLAVQPSASFYQGSYADNLFWYSIDAGIRLASSGWDRLALLLDLAFSLNLKSNCNFRMVMNKLTDPASRVKANAHLVALNDFRNNEFQQLERRSEKGKGLRDEATHLLHPGTRYYFEWLEQQGGAIRSPQEWLDIVLRHYRHYWWGVRVTIQLIDQEIH